MSKPLFPFFPHSFPSGFPLSPPPSLSLSLCLCLCLSLSLSPSLSLCVPPIAPPTLIPRSSLSLSASLSLSPVAVLLPPPQSLRRSCSLPGGVPCPLHRNQRAAYLPVEDPQR